MRASASCARILLAQSVLAAVALAGAVALRATWRRLYRLLNSVDGTAGAACRSL
jgi:hypothetical protein